MNYILKGGEYNMKKIIKISVIILCILFVFGVILGLLSSDGQENFQKGREKGQTTESEDAIDQMSSLERMEVAFIGNPSPEEIKHSLDQALKLYGTEITEENYNRAGSVLVALRKESKTGVTEMEILEYMIQSYVEDINMSFQDIAAISFTALEKNIDGN